MDVLQIRRAGLIGLRPCANHCRPYSNGDTSNQRSLFALFVGSCGIPSLTVM